MLGAGSHRVRFQQRAQHAIASGHVFRYLAGATLLLSVTSGVLVWIIDRRDFATLGDGLWWSIVTLATVGYGDVVPHTAWGRVVGAVVIVVGVTFLSVLTAIITTYFVSADQDARAAAASPPPPDPGMSGSDLEQRADAFRALRAGIEASVLPLATSLDGRRFSFQARVDGLALRLGGYVALEGDGPPVLGQVRALALAEVDVGDVAPGAGPGDGLGVRTRMPIRIARGDGLLLDRDATPFHDRLARPATPAEVEAWLAAAAPRRARLAVGRLSLAGDVPATLDAGGFDRHTFLCGQSGSGKSYALGVVLEQLLLETELRLVIIDPNSDFARLRDAAPGADAAAARRWEALAAGIAVRSAGAPGAARLRLRFADLAAATQGALLQLDPIADREEYAELAAALADARPESLAELARGETPAARRLTLRIGNLGVERWGVWARDDPGSVLDALDDPAVRCLVVDTGSLPTRAEQALVAEAVLSGLWDRRGDRRPVLAVIDEAHNVCPAAPGDPLTARAAEHAVRIAGEGRKYGIYLLVASQRPQKVDENVLSQCDNIILMRLNSAADGAFVAERFGFAPPGLIGLATDFGLGQALVAGKLASHPSVLAFGTRVAREGGGDVDAAWSTPRRG